MFTVFNAKGEATFETNSYSEAAKVARARKQSFRYIKEEEREKLVFTCGTKEPTNTHKDKIVFDCVLAELKGIKKR